MDSSSNEPWKTEEILGLIGWIIVLLVPTIGVVEYNANGPYSETTFFWPWMVLAHLEPSTVFNTNQFSFFSFPWTLILYIPFLYSLKYLYDLFKGVGDRIHNAGYVALMGLAQMALIWVTYRSQTPGVNEEITVYYIPEILLFLIFGYHAGVWYLDKSKAILEQSQDTDVSSEEGK